MSRRGKRVRPVAVLLQEHEMSNNTLGWAALGAVILGALVWIASELMASDNAMSGHGWVALVLGAIGTAAVAGVLMWLLFQSDRHGYDR